VGGWALGAAIAAVTGLVLDSSPDEAARTSR
jgi:hypothetical protein